MIKKQVCCIMAIVFAMTVLGQTNTFPTSGNVGIGTTTPGSLLHVNGHTTIGDSYDPIAYGMIQLVRPALPSDNKFYLSFIRNGSSVSGIGYMTNSNTLGIWHANSNAGVPTLAFTPDQRVGIGMPYPPEKLSIAGSDGNIHIGNTLFAGYNGIWLNGSTVATDYNFLSKASDYNLYINRPGGAAIYFRMTNNTQVMIGSNGNVGIGPNHTTEAKLDITTNTSNDGILLRYSTTGFVKLHSNSMTLGSGNPITRAGDAGFTFGGNGAADAHDFGFVLAPWSNIESGLRMNKDGRVSIGTWRTTTGYKLFVEEGIRTRKVKVDQVTWADYVFDDDYKLRPLADVAAFIEKNKHLPDVPSAAEVVKEGLDLGNGQATLLRKIEELTLYVLQLKQENDEQGKIIKQLQQTMIR